MKNYYSPDALLTEKLKSFAPSAELIPGIVTIHDIKKFSLVFMSAKGLKLLGITLRDLRSSVNRYHLKFFNNSNTELFFQDKESGKKQESFSFIQQVKIKGKESPTWYISSTEVFEYDAEGNPSHVVTVAMPINNLENVSHKLDRFMEEKAFIESNTEKFLSLGERGKEILRLVALGKSSSEIAHELHISVETVSTHRKTIKRKLGIVTNYEFSEYARAFDLI